VYPRAVVVAEPGEGEAGGVGHVVVSAVGEGDVFFDPRAEPGCVRGKEDFAGFEEAGDGCESAFF